MVQRNSALDAIKLVLACCVVALHFNWKIIPRGYLAVEFFFVLSGFLIHQSGGYLKYSPIRAMKRIYPIYLASIIIVLCFSNQHYNLWSIILSFFMLQSIGLNDTVINVPSWFLCVYMISVPVIAYIIKHFDKYKYGTIIFCSIVPLVVYSILYNNTPSSGFNYSFEFKIYGITVGLWRCWAGIFLGILTSTIYNNLNRISFILSSLLEFCLIVYFVIVFSFSGWSPQYDYISLPMIVGAVILLARRSGCLSKLLDLLGRKLNISGTLSTYTFLLHFPLIMVLNEISGKNYTTLYLAGAFTIVVVGLIINITGPSHNRPAT